ncbi:histidine kinase [Actinoplanes sp. NPDC051851]|uniref:sensor histidine kinase n=1 Tax=Actinoplanes sp. NPDC051851 TaxID=3154753 RepID=UPI00341434D4
MRVPRAFAVTAYTLIGLSASVEAITIGKAHAAGRGLPSLACAVAAAIVLHRRPVVALLLLTTGPTLGALLGWDPVADYSMAVFGAFLLTLRGTSGLLVAALVGTGNTVAAGLHAGTVVISVDPAAGVAGFAALVAASAGSAVRSQRLYRAELEHRTQAALESRESAVRQGVAEERVRIARDLHDSVGHQIAVVSMHLGAAEVHLSADPGRASGDIGAARTGVQAVLRETQQILRVLRIGDGEPPPPTPGHGEVAGLVDRLRAAGLRVDATLPGLSCPMPAPVSAAVYRIVQEALTNAQRYGTGSATLRLDVVDDAVVVIEVTNTRAGDAPGRHRTGGGHGIAGMRERAESTGGVLDVRLTDGLFRLRARLPLRGETPA